jgi:ribonuclease P/MRP protein subunit RPP20
MGAAVPICLTLAASIPDILPFGPGEIKTEILTGTVEVRDEIIPENDDEDISYANRSKSTVSVTLTIGDGVDGTRPKKKSSLSGKRPRKKKIQGPKAEIVLPEPDQDDMDVL